MTDRLLEQLKHVDPVDANAVRRRVPSTERLIEILGSEPISDPPRRNPFTARRVVLAAAVAAAIVAVASSLPGGGGATPDAASALESVAAIASAEAAPGAAGEISYFKTVSSLDGGAAGPARGADPYAWQQVMTTEDWVAPDGSGRRRTVAGEIEFADRRDEHDWRDSGSPRLGPAPGTVTTEGFGSGELNGVPYEGALPPVSNLPADADELERVLREEAARSSGSVPVDAKLFEYSASILLSTGTRPDLRAAVYELLARIDGVRLIDDVEDPLGREGTGVSLDIAYTGAPVRHTVIFDSETSYPLAYTEDPIPPAPAHLVITLQPAYIALEESGQVGELGSRP
jgi:hypothetical protein